MTPPSSTPPARRTLADWLEMAQAYHESGDTPKAERLLRKLLEARPDDPHLLNLLGTLRAGAGDHDEAVAIFRRAVAASGPNPALLANLGQSLEARGEVESALQAYAEAVALAPDNAAAHHQLGVAYQRHGRHTEAAQAFERTLASSPDDPGALKGLGAALQSLGRLDEAMTCYEGALAQAPEEAEALNNLAILHQVRGRSEEAVDLLQRVVKLSPESAEAHLNLARALLDAERLEAARRAAHRALELRPDWPRAEFARGQVLERSGQLEEAHDSYAHALAGDPTLLPVRLHLSRLNRRLVPRWHFPMLNDALRNRAYDEALRAVIEPGATVLDIGTGSGLLAMMAVRAGAGHVYACEQVPVIARAARHIIAENGLADRITVIAHASTDLRLGRDLPGPVDVLACEIFDTGLLSEGVIPVLEHARRELLVPGGVVLPRGAEVFAALVESDELRAEEEVAQAAGFDVSHFNTFADVSYSQRRLDRYPHRLLSDPFRVFTFDFTGAAILDQSRDLSAAVKTPGRCDAIAFWFTLDLDGKHSVSTGPEVESCWSQAVQIVSPRALEKGGQVELTAMHDGNMIHFALTSDG